MATQNVYVSEGTSYTFKSSGGTVLWTPDTIALGTGRISAVWDRGASPRPVRYKWRMQCQWAATATSGDMLRLYIITSNASATAAQTDGEFTFGDAAITSSAPAELPLTNCCRF